ncbi:MAG: hypothetical protein JWM88_333 [Verrucomicrobia bacterium]|nr:hypothetical protein [Verrucomicrobiota bacterium]
MRSVQIQGRVVVVAGLLAWLSPRQGRAEDSVAYKYEDYAESGGRISVQAQYGRVEKDLGPDLHFKLQGVIDAIAGATPNGEPPATPGGPVPLTELHDRRKAWSTELSRQFPRVNVTLGYANSRESDYVSDAWSVNTLTDFNQKNTTLLAGVAVTNDDVRVLYLFKDQKKRSLDLIAGVTQLLGPSTSVTCNLGYGRSTGFLGDPYRLIQKRTEVFPGLFLPVDYGESRPHERDKWTVQASVNHAVAAVHGAVEAGYRYYQDSFGSRAHTVEAAWFQQCGEHLVLSPSVRFYEQDAADFYLISLNGQGFTPAFKPNPAGPYYSSDYRLSALRSLTLGLKAVWTFNASWQFDAAIEKYEMRGTDGMTSQSAYPRATMKTVGLKFTW